MSNNAVLVGSKSLGCGCLLETHSKRRQNRATCNAATFPMQTDIRNSKLLPRPTSRGDGQAHTSGVRARRSSQPARRRCSDRKFGDPNTPPAAHTMTTRVCCTHPLDGQKRPRSCVRVSSLKLPGNQYGHHLGVFFRWPKATQGS